MKAEPVVRPPVTSEEKSVNRRIFSAAATIAVLTLMVKVAGMAKEMIVAAWFGTGDEMDAFLIAFLLPTYVMNVAAGSLSAALIPTQIEVRERQGDLAAERLFRSVSAFSGAFFFVTMLLLALLGPFVLPYLCSGFSPEKMALVQKLFMLLLPTIIITGFATNWEALLNVGERFGMAAIAPAAVSVGTLAMIWICGHQWGIYALAAGTLVGSLLQLAMLGSSLKRRGFAIWPAWHGMDANVKKVIDQYVPMIAGSLLFCSTILVDQAMASTLAPGSVSTLNYGNKLVALAVGLGTAALGTAVLPHFSRMTALQDWSGIRHTLKTYTWLILGVTVPATAVAMYLSTPLAAILFQRGNFTAQDTLAVSWVQQMFFLQIPFYSLSLLYVRMISSLKGNRIVMWGAFFGFCVNIAMNFVLMRVMGVAGLALSTSLVYLFMCLFTAVMLLRCLRRAEGGLA
jgi:putative peptidoglycan lipid II flippase